MKLNVLTVGVLTLAFTSCNIPEGTSGPLDSEIRTIPSFNSINMEGSIDVVYIQDTAKSVTVEAGANMLQHIQTDVVNGKLLIYESNNQISNYRNITVYIHNDQLNEITMEGSGDFDGSNLIGTTINVTSTGSGDFHSNGDFDTIQSMQSGSGDLHWNGTTMHTQCTSSGSGDFTGRFLNGLSADVSSSGSGDISIHATQTLNVSMSGSGDVYYYGNPNQVFSNIVGSGNLIQK